VVIGWVVGRYEVRALLAGVDLGVDKVVRSARQIAVIQDRRGPDRDDGPDLDILLPRVEVTHRNLLESEDVRVDL
jgi:hypothetical protein